VTVTATETIRREIFVDAAPETAFRVFTEQTAAWWPLQKYGIFLEDAETVVFEDRNGWRLVEKAKDGRETEWGEVLDYEFASRLRLTWHPGRDADNEPTEVEVTFTADKDGTLVVLEHRGWENLTGERREGREGYASGWPGVLEQYRQVAEKSQS
jgi:uncharacterized protein YndB with AHSA1/START domain